MRCQLRWILNEPFYVPPMGDGLKVDEISDFKLKGGK